MTLRMRKWFRGVSVDSGIIIIADREFYTPYGKFKSRKTYKKLQKRFRLLPGEYFIKWHIPNSHFGSIRGEGELISDSSFIFVCDPAYIVRDSKWQEFLDDTIITLPFSREQDVPYGIIFLDEMGGDRKYDIELEIERVQLF